MYLLSLTNNGAKLCEVAELGKLKLHLGFAVDFWFIVQVSTSATLLQFLCCALVLQPTTHDSTSLFCSVHCSSALAVADLPYYDFTRPAFLVQFLPPYPVAVLVKLIINVLGTGYQRFAVYCLGLHKF